MQKMNCKYLSLIKFTCLWAISKGKTVFVVFSFVSRSTEEARSSKYCFDWVIFSKGELRECGILLLVSLQLQLIVLECSPVGKFHSVLCSDLLFGHFASKHHIEPKRSDFLDTVLTKSYYYKFITCARLHVFSLPPLCPFEQLQLITSALIPQDKFGPELGRSKRKNVEIAKHIIRAITSLSSRSDADGAWVLERVPARLSK